ncbi:MAG: tRNA1(Val) (adenine(37)-N6)-methyltransferase [Lachnospira sp.]|nr:tRNA1(Val) (adenine(37)-N6)-methyltransferase [Lachnospira sp.]
MMNDDERIDDLQRNGYRIIQNKNCFCFGMDAVLLSSFAKAEKGERVLDLGTGNGVIPILMQAKNPGAFFSGLEIQEVSADLARRSVELNGIGEYVNIVQGDIKEASAIFGGASFNVVTTNPPYMNENHGIVNPDSAKAIARHELLCTLEDVVREASKCLKMRGRFYMVHRPQRLVEIFDTMTRYHLEPKRMRMIHPHEDKEANMVLIEAVKGGRTLLKTEQPLVVYNDDGTYTQKLLEMY